MWWGWFGMVLMGGWVMGCKEKKERGGLVGFGWEWKSEGVVEGWGGVGWGR
jgi:hypothetical protein